MFSREFYAHSHIVFVYLKTFNELDNLEIAMGSDEEETEQSPPPIPPRTSSAHPERPLPITIENNGQLLHTEINNSDSSNSTSSDAPDLLEDTSEESSDTDSDDASNEEKERGYKSSNFDANSSLPPVPNGTLDLTSPTEKQKFSSDEERYESCVFNLKSCRNEILKIISHRSPLMSDNNVTNNNNKSSEIRYRRAARQEALQEKVREIKRKQKEEEIKKINLPKKRRSLLIISGFILALSVFAYVYVKT